MDLSALHHCSAGVKVGYFENPELKAGGLGASVGQGGWSSWIRRIKRVPVHVLVILFS